MANDPKRTRSNLSGGAHKTGMPPRQDVRPWYRLSMTTA
jgi:hypothetical protein